MYYVNMLFPFICLFFLCYDKKSQGFFRYFENYS